MRLAVFGASGGTGRLFTAQAAAAGHQVVAVVRDPARVTGTNLTVVRADIMDSATLTAVVRGFDAVVSLLDPGPVHGETGSTTLIYIHP